MQAVSSMPDCYFRLLKAKRRTSMPRTIVIPRVAIPQIIGLPVLTRRRTYNRPLVTNTNGVVGGCPILLIFEDIGETSSRHHGSRGGYERTSSNACA